MTMPGAAPLVVVVAGANGAGKTTIAPHLLRDALRVPEFVNGDAIARGMSWFRPQSVEMAAGRVMLARLDALEGARADFAFETTLASRTFAARLRRLRGAGYRTHACFLSLPSADLAVQRVAERVRAGGHDVPEPVIRRRYAAGLRNFFGLYQAVLDAWQLHDNSGPWPRPVATRSESGPITVLDERGWDHLQRKVADERAG